MEIIIAKGECQKYVFFPQNNGTYTRKFIVEEGAVFRGGAIAIWSDMDLKLSVFITGDHAQGSLDLLGIARDGASLSLDGIGQAAPWCQDVKLRIDQNNILIWEGARVKAKPVLIVATDSIEWGHSCRIHRISSEARYYLESHGIDATSAEGMLLSAEITRIGDLLGTQWEQLKEEILLKLQR